MPLQSPLFPFTALLLAGAPEHGGVYALWSQGELVYIGRAGGDPMTIRSRLLDHFSGQDGPCTQNATHYAWEICLDSAARELELLEEYRAAFRRLPRCNRSTG
jgi:hypothetical protein